MRKSELDHLLEAAVAKAVGVSLPRTQNRRKPARVTRKSLARMPARVDFSHAYAHM